MTKLLLDDSSIAWIGQSWQNGIDAEIVK